MLQTSLHINSHDNKPDHNKKEPTNIIPFHDVRKPVAPGKTYLAAERSNEQLAGNKTSASTVMFDIFGASDY